MSRRLLRPEPYTGPCPSPIDGSTPPGQVAERLIAGQGFLITDRYRTGARILEALTRRLPAPKPDAPFPVRDAAQRRFRDAASGLIVQIRDHHPVLSDARPNGFLRELFPDQPDFLLPLVSLQTLHGAWERFNQGAHLAVIGQRLHPFYGTYVPTRTTHLELFGTWLSQYTGQRGVAVDVGTGCGVLALMLWRADFDRVWATDINPNAIESVRRDLNRMLTVPRITPVCADLLGEGPPPADLIVFNPPWIRGEIHGPIDRALHYDDDLFERFFDQARTRLRPHGRIVMVFSNVIALMQPDVPHPIQSALDRGGLRLVQKLHRKVKPERGPGGRRRRTRERVEIWELATT